MSVDMNAAYEAGTASGDGARPRLGVLAALPQELGDLIEAMRAEGGMRTVTLGKRDYHIGTAYGVPCVVTLARVGKVAAAASASALIHVFGVASMVFTGVAGGLGAGVRVGDIVVADALLQHDMDASPLFPRYEVPLLERAHFPAHAPLADALEAACVRFVSEEAHALAERFAFDAPRVHRGLIVSGDRFVSSTSEVPADVPSVCHSSVPDEVVALSNSFPLTTPSITGEDEDEPLKISATSCTVPASFTRYSSVPSAVVVAEK